MYVVLDQSECRNLTQSLTPACNLSEDKLPVNDKNIKLCMAHLMSFYYSDCYCNL